METVRSNRELPGETDVLIVGSGPTGLTLGCVLAAARGIPFVLIDRIAEGANITRGRGARPHAGGVLEQPGVTPGARGHVVPPLLTGRG
ncbi:MAG: FAD-dependent monooxygenase [bacterium]